MKHTITCILVFINCVNYLYADEYDNRPSISAMYACINNQLFINKEKTKFFYYDYQDEKRIYSMSVDFFCLDMARFRRAGAILATYENKPPYITQEEFDAMRLWQQVSSTLQDDFKHHFMKIAKVILK